MNMVYKVLALLLPFMLYSATFAADDNVYKLTLFYDDGTIAKQSLRVLPYIFVKPEVSPADNYRLEVMSFGDQILYARNFSFGLEVHYMPPPPGTFDDNGVQISVPQAEVTQVTQSEIELTIPYFADAKKINIYEPSGAKALEVSVAQFADTCGDNACQAHESYESCSTDCRSGSADDYCDAVADGICDPDCSASRDLDCGASGADGRGQLPLPLIGIGAVIILLGGVLVYIFSRLQKGGEA
ncbi:MAG TPA: hypothetical protein VI979_00395 [archaeon]|nr:hypothetical protein [archaeon]